MGTILSNTSEMHRIVGASVSLGMSMACTYKARLLKELGDESSLCYNIGIATYIATCNTYHRL